LLGGGRIGEWGDDEVRNEAGETCAGVRTWEMVFGSGAKRARRAALEADRGRELEDAEDEADVNEIGDIEAGMVVEGRAATVAAGAGA